MDAALVGNIGYSFARQVAEDPKPLYVAEISSFQLDDIIDFRPDVAVLLNITEDHLDRYEYKFEKYIRSKFNIVKNQKPEDIFIYCADDPVITQYIKENPLHSNLLPFSMYRELPKGAFIRDKDMILTIDGESFETSVYDFALKGKHNQYNSMAASLTGATIGIRKEKYA